MTTGAARNLESLQAAFALLPTPAALVEPGTARMIYANPAADRLAGGRFPLAGATADYPGTYRLFSPSGEPLPEHRYPGLRVARGERFTNVELDWHTPANGLRSLIVTGDTIIAPDGEPIGVLTFEDVTALRGAERSERRVRRELEAILDHVADAIVVQGERGELIYVNHAAIELLGFADAEAARAAPAGEVRARFELTDEAGRPVPGERYPGRRALRGEEPEPMIVRMRRLDGGAARWRRLKARPLRDDRGRVVMAINLIEDVTDIKQAELDQRFLAEAGRVLASSLDYERTLRTVAALAVPSIADWCVVDLAGEGGFERVALAHADPAKLRWTEEVSRRYPPDPRAPHGVAEVLRTGRSELYTHIDDALLAASARDEDHLRLLRSLGMRSAMIVPMLSAGRTIGAISLIAAESGRHFGSTELALAEELGRRAGSAIENARLYRQRSEIARTLQSSLLPPAMPEIERLASAAVFQPAGEGYDVGGDFYDLFSTSEEQWFAVVGDVCGKGAEAAATTAMVRYTIRAAAVRRRSPAAILEWLNDAMLRQGTGPLRFCTLAIVRFDLGPGGIRAVGTSAGHPLPRILRAGGGTVDRLGTHGTLVGVTPDIEIEERATELHPGDRIVMFTDGLIEARAPAVVWSMDDVDAQLRGAARRAEDLQGVLDELARAALGGDGAPARDDLAILGLQVR